MNNRRCLDRTKKDETKEEDKEDDDEEAENKKLMWIWDKDENGPRSGRKITILEGKQRLAKKPPSILFSINDKKLCTYQVKFIILFYNYLLNNYFF